MIDERQRLEEELQQLQDYQKPWIKLTRKERDRIKPKVASRPGLSELVNNSPSEACIRDGSKIIFSPDHRSSL
jgi:hypothetical protein